MAPEREQYTPQWERRERWEEQPTKRKVVRPRHYGLRDNLSAGRKRRQYQTGPWGRESQRRKRDDQYDAEIAELQERLDTLSRQRGSGRYQSTGSQRYSPAPARKPAIGFQNAADNLSGRNGPVAFIIAFIALVILLGTCIPVVVIGG